MITVHALFDVVFGDPKPRRDHALVVAGLWRKDEDERRDVSGGSQVESAVTHPAFRLCEASAERYAARAKAKREQSSRAQGPKHHRGRTRKRPSSRRTAPRGATRTTTGRYAHTSSQHVDSATKVGTRSASVRRSASRSRRVCAVVNASTVGPPSSFTVTSRRISAPSPGASRTRLRYQVAGSPGSVERVGGAPPTGRGEIPEGNRRSVHRGHRLEGVETGGPQPCRWSIAGVEAGGG